MSLGEMIYKKYSSRSLEEIESSLRESATRQGFHMSAVHDLRDTFRRHGLLHDTPCVIFEICNSAQAKRAFDMDGGLSALMPCRISVYGTSDGLCLATVLPTVLMGPYDNPELTRVAVEVEEAALEILKDAAG